VGFPALPHDMKMLWDLADLQRDVDPELRKTVARVNGSLPACSTHDPWTDPDRIAFFEGRADPQCILCRVGAALALVDETVRLKGGIDEGQDPRGWRRLRACRDQPDVF
jgi:hypothetical protein